MDKKENISSYDLFKNLELNKIYEKLPRPVVVADNLRTPENMGSVLRLAANIGAEKVLFIKDDGLPDVRNWKIKKTASGADEKVKWEFCNKESLREKIPAHYKIIAVETSEKAKNIYRTILPEKAAFIMGNEVYGIRQEILELADETVYIPIPGVISSLNVTHSLAVVLFEWLRQNTKS